MVKPVFLEQWSFDLFSSSTFLLNDLVEKYPFLFLTSFVAAHRVMACSHQLKSSIGQ